MVFKPISCRKRLWQNVWYLFENAQIQSLFKVFHRWKTKKEAKISASFLPEKSEIKLMHTRIGINNSGLREAHIRHHRRVIHRSRAAELSLNQ